MSIDINPGTGPVDGTREQARANMDVLAADVAAEHGYDLGTATITFVPVEAETVRVEPFTMVLSDGRTVTTEPAEHTCDPEADGRFTFALAFGDVSFEIEMPGVPVERVRYTGADDQNIWDYPRLYVDGSSWVWRYAVAACTPDRDVDD